MQKVLLVDDNPNVLYSFKRTLHSVSNQWIILTAESAADALEIISRESVDIIISDLRMPIMDGVTLLGIVANQSPSTLRIAITGDADPVLCQQATLVAHQFIAKPIEPQELTRIINQAVGVSSLVMKADVKKAILKIANLPSQPSLYNQLLAELNKPDVDLDYLASVISQDISMTAKILQLVNSAYFGLAREVKEVSQAVFYLGVETIRDLSLSVHLFSQFDQALIARSGLGNLWDHSLRVASCSRAIAASSISDKKLISGAFTAGLLHDIGKLILGTTAPDFYSSKKYLQVEDKFQNLMQEKLEFGSTHADIGAYLLGSWGLPQEIINAVLTHHSFESQKPIEFTTSMAVWFANAYVCDFSNEANANGFQPTDNMLQNQVLAPRLISWNKACEQILSK
ncbi:MAG: Response regulator receiver modulated metal dependent phosphohydrolase [uncultured bacterium]|nr:MAG: Response regulator receiver modulated metal dependent phosphohydrolase [uncultured bacterium]